MKSVIGGLARSLGDANVLDHILNLLGRRWSKAAYDKGYGEIDQHSDKAYSLGRYAEPILCAFRKELKINNVA